MVSGSIALNIYTIPRLTRDINIVIDLSEKKIDEFISLFPNSYYDKNTIKKEIKRKGMFNIIDHSTGFKIDFIIRKEFDIQNLLLNPEKDVGYIKYWCDKLKLQTFNLLDNE